MKIYIYVFPKIFFIILGLMYKYQIHFELILHITWSKGAKAFPGGASGKEPAC